MLISWSMSVKTGVLTTYLLVKRSPPKCPIFFSVVFVELESKTCPENSNKTSTLKKTPVVKNFCKWVFRSTFMGDCCSSSGYLDAHGKLGSSASSAGRSYRSVPPEVGNFWISFGGWVLWGKGPFGHQQVLFFGAKHRACYTWGH